MMQSLTEEVLEYKESGVGWQKLLDRISLYVYVFPSKWTDWDEDKRSEFFIAFYPRIPGIIRRYEPDYAFETYLCCSLRWFMKTFLETLLRQEHYASWCRDEAIAHFIQRPGDGGVLDSPEPVIPEKYSIETDTRGKLKDPTIRRRLLYAFLLRIADADDEQIRTIARLTDVDEEWLFDKVADARSMISVKMEQKEMLKKRRNDCWFRLDEAENRLRSGKFESNERRQRWERDVSTWRERHELALEKVRRLKVSPSHGQIGKLLDIPTGTVSSGLHLLRKYAEKKTGVKNEHPRPRETR